MNDTERLKCETEMLPKLKRHLNSVLSLRPIGGLSPLSVSILKNAKGFTDEIGAWAGSLTRWEGADERFKDLLASMKVNCTAEEVEVIETALESFEWVYDDLKCYPYSVCKSLNGDEVFWAWDFLFMSDEQIKHGDDSDGENRLGRRRIVLKRFADLGINVLGLGEKSKAVTEGESPPASTIEEVEPLDMILETAASLKVKFEREGTSYTESELSEMISTLLIEFEGSEMESGEREAFKRLKEVWDAPFDQIEPDGWVESHLPPLARAEFEKKHGKGSD